MKKILTFILTAAMAVTVLCSTAMARTIVPETWDLNIELRKADADNVKKDGVIGENEYEKINISGDELFLNYNIPEEEGAFEYVLNNAKKIADTIEYYFSWDDEHGFNMAVRYKVENYDNDLTATDESFLMSPAGGLLLQVFYDSDCKQHPDTAANGNALYYALAKNIKTDEIVTCTYDGQAGFKQDYVFEDTDVAIAYDANTKYVTYEWSIPLDAVAENPAVDGKINFNLAAVGGDKMAGGWDAKTYVVNLGQTGFFVDQQVVTSMKSTVATISDKAVGYVEPEPTPTPAPIEEDNADSNTIFYIIMAVEAIAIIALIAVAAKKNKKQ